MKDINVEEIDVPLAAIVDEAIATQSEIVITRNGVAVARIVPCQVSPLNRHYPLRGMPITIAADFDEPMPELWEALGA
jgi:antitoxin (DNA-binding transcriptional repressor) of toxin-antitoxin stability system